MDEKNSQKLSPADLADRAGFASLANELRLHVEAPLPSSTPLASQMTINDIRVKKTTIVRLVVKRENVSPKDASCQTSEDSKTPPRYVDTKLLIDNTFFYPQKVAT